MQCLFCTPYSYTYSNTKVIQQVSQAHVTSVLCKRVGVALQATVETLYEKQNTEVCGVLFLIQSLNGCL